MLVCAVDNSITSPGIIKAELDENFDVVSKKFFSSSTVKKYEYEESDNKILHYKDDFSHQFDKIIHIHEEVKKWLGDDKYEYVAFEDYSFGSKGQVFSIAESTGILKQYFYNSGSKIRLYSVPSIKMFFTGKGNSDKVSMEDNYDRLDDSFDLSFLPKVYEGKSNNPCDNIIDAFAILKMLIMELKLRNGFKIDLDDKKTTIFVTKSPKKKEIPYCEKDFIEKII